MILTPLWRDSDAGRDADVIGDPVTESTKFYISERVSSLITPFEALSKCKGRLYLLRADTKDASTPLRQIPSELDSLATDSKGPLLPWGRFKELSIPCGRSKSMAHYKIWIDTKGSLYSFGIQRALYFFGIDPKGSLYYFGIDPKGSLLLWDRSKGLSSPLG